MNEMIEIKREGLERLIQECSDAWWALYDYRERYGVDSECADRQLVEAVTYINALDYITGREWYYDSDKERVVPVED